VADFEEELSMMKPYYESDGFVIYHGDCRDVLPTLGAVDLVLTDPPYSDVTHKGARGGNGTHSLVDFAATTSNELRAIVESLSTVCQRWLVATMEWRHIADLERAPPSGWRFVRFGIWVKPNGAPQFTGDRPSTGWEGIGILHRDVPGRMRWNGGGRHAVWTVNKCKGDHPTQKPVGLIGKLAELFSDPGDTILDPFMGSGTTLRAAKDLGRKAVGIEIEERYCEIAAKRLAQEVMRI
jgi:site-specific DNA-methyltransferase (adenine-specific)